MDPGIQLRRGRNLASVVLMDGEKIQNTEVFVKPNNPFLGRSLLRELELSDIVVRKWDNWFYYFISRGNGGVTNVNTKKNCVPNSDM